LRRLDLRKTQAARLNTIRDINRQIVLNYIREREPISRAEIAREADLQRSTISAIVEDLAAEGLVEEVGEGESTGGRRPTLLRLRTKEPIAIGVAITPTFTIVATSDLAGRIVEQKEFLTDPDPDRTLEQVISLVREFSVKNKDSIEAVGVSLPGLVDPATGTAVYQSRKRSPPHSVCRSRLITTPTPSPSQNFGLGVRRLAMRAILFWCWSRKASAPELFSMARFIAASAARPESLATW
jgi:DNA-binding transcriptional ArsR family regulator